jgi:hypothetical protein
MSQSKYITRNWDSTGRIISRRRERERRKISLAAATYFISLEQAHIEGPCPTTAATVLAASSTSMENETL